MSAWNVGQMLRADLTKLGIQLVLIYENCLHWMLGQLNFRTNIDTNDSFMNVAKTQMIFSSSTSLKHKYIVRLSMLESAKMQLSIKCLCVLCNVYFFSRLTFTWARTIDIKIPRCEMTNNKIALTCHTYNHTISLNDCLKYCWNYCSHTQSNFTYCDHTKCCSTFAEIIV